MDQKGMLLRMMRKEFGNLLNVGRIKVVTVTAVNYATEIATIQLAQGEAGDPVPDEQDMTWIRSYLPYVNDLAYMLLTEGAPVLIGAVEDSAWTDFALPSGYTAVVGFEVPGYRRDSTGRVWLRGCCNIAASNVAGTKFTVPVGYRVAVKTYASFSISNGAAVSPLRLDINTDGTLATLVTTPAATQIASFEGVSYDIRP